MNDPLTEDERLAALADGRLGERERAEMVARITADDDAYEVFAVLAAILHEAEAPEGADGQIATDDADVDTAGDADGSSTPAFARPGGAPPLVAVSAGGGGAPEADAEPGVIRLHPKKPAAALRWLAIAAGIAALALAVRTLRPGTSSASDPVRLAARLEQVDQGLPLGWRPAWSAARGDGALGDLTDEEKAAHAARAGAMLVDLSVAVRGRDAVRTQLLAGQIAQRYDRQRSRTGEWKEIEDGAGGAPNQLEPLVQRATDRIAARLEREGLELGAWTEAARLAAERRDARFFRDRATRPMLDRLASRTAADPSARAAVERVRGLAEADPLPWDSIGTALHTLSRELGSE